MARVLDKIVTSLKSLTISGVKKVGVETGKAVAKTGAMLGGLEAGIKNIAKAGNERLVNAIDLTGTDMEAAGIY